MIKIALAEDNGFLAQSIEEKISFFKDLKFKYRGANGNEFIGKLEQDSNIDVILMDIQMPEKDGIETTQYIKSKYPHIKILMLTVFDDTQNIFKAIQAGANGYLLKETSPTDLYKAIIDVMNEGAAMTPSITQKTLGILRDPSKIKADKNEEKISLSKRECEVMKQLAEGLNYKEIANNLIISPSTVRKHIQNIYKKLDVNNKIEAIRKAMKHDII